MKIVLFILLLFSFTASRAQLNEAIVGKWKLNCLVSTEFSDSETANKQVATNKLKYLFFENSNWEFKKDKHFEVKLSDGKIEKGSYSANEDRFIIIFDKEDIEEFNTAIITAKDKDLILNMGRGMTRLLFQFSKK